MKVWMTYETHNPTTTSDHAVTIKCHCSGTEQEIGKILEYCQDKIGTMLVLDIDDKEQVREALLTDEDNLY